MLHPSKQEQRLYAETWSFTSNTISFLKINADYLKDVLKEYIYFLHNIALETLSRTEETGKNNKIFYL
jgi:hypothetical protein